MELFFLGLTVLERILFIVASAATALLIVQIILLLLGFSGAEFGDIGDVDSVDMDIDASAGAQLSLFTVKGIIAFFSVGGWVGLAVSQAGGHFILVILLALIAGGLAMYGIAYVYSLAQKLQSDGQISMNNAIGQVGKVYLTVPPKGKGAGKVTLTIQERYIEAEAIQEGENPIKSEELIRVMGCHENTLIVEKYD